MGHKVRTNQSRSNSAFYSYEGLTDSDLAEMMPSYQEVEGWTDMLSPPERKPSRAAKVLILATLGTVLLVVALSLFSGCGDDKVVYTWGDVSEDLAGKVCTAVESCGATHSETCQEHVAWHLCKPQGDCDVAVDEDAAKVALDACQASLEADNACFILAFGFVPQPCLDVLQLEPKQDAGP